MATRKNKCVDCMYNKDKSGLDCELYCAGAVKTRKSSDGTVYITACDDYLKDGVSLI